MPKKTVCALLVFAVISILAYDFCSVASAEESKPSATLLMEVNTGTVLVEQNGYEALPVGTLSKVMTALLVAEAIDRGELALDTTVTASTRATAADGAVIWLLTGEKMTVSELLMGLVIGNANDAAIALAEAVAGTEADFVGLMNSRASELGLKSTVFDSCTGFPDSDGQYSTAYDLALVSRELLKYDFLSGYLTTWLDYVRNGETELVNENTLVRTYDGVLGIKAGHSEKSGQSVIAAARRESGAYIAVVLGCNDKDARFSEAKKLLNTAFGSYETVNPSFSSELLMPLKIKKGVDMAVEIRAEDLSSLVVPKGASSDISTSILLPSYITAPVRKGQPVGTVAFYRDDTLLYETSLIAADRVERRNFRSSFKKILLKMFK